MKKHTLTTPLRILKHTIFARPSGHGEIRLQLTSGEVVIEMGSYLGNISTECYEYCTEPVGGLVDYIPICDYSIKVVNRYIKNTKLLDRYMEEAQESASKSM